MVEVPAHERHEAFTLLESHRPELHAPPNTPRTQPVPLWFTVSNVLIALLWFTFLTAWMIVAAAAWPTDNVIDPTPLPMYFTSSEFSRVWGSLFVVTVLFAILQVLRVRSRRRLLPRRA
jgi:hypothetical protein